MSDDTIEAVRRWVAKAESDWRAVGILSRDPQCPRDAVCFHCQQFVEKLLKALLTLHEIEAPPTHNLRRLIQLAAPAAAELGKLIDASDTLTVHGVQSRYPDDWREIEADEMSEAITIAERFGAVLRPKVSA